MNYQGMKAQDTAELFFENIQVSKSAILGEVKVGFKYLMCELPQVVIDIIAVAYLVIYI